MTPRNMLGICRTHLYVLAMAFTPLVSSAAKAEAVKNLPFGEWELACEDNAVRSVVSCGVIASVEDDRDSTRWVDVVFGIDAPGNKVLRVFASSDASLQDGLALSLGKEQFALIAFIGCPHDGCAAEKTISSGDWKKIVGSKSVSFAYRQLSGKLVEFSFGTVGLDDALEYLGSLRLGEIPPEERQVSESDKSKNGSVSNGVVEAARARAMSAVARKARLMADRAKAALNMYEGPAKRARFIQGE